MVSRFDKTIWSSISMWYSISRVGNMVLENTEWTAILVVKYVLNVAGNQSTAEIKSLVVYEHCHQCFFLPNYAFLIHSDLLAPNEGPPNLHIKIVSKGVRALSTNYQPYNWR